LVSTFRRPDPFLRGTLCGFNFAPIHPAADDGIRFQTIGSRDGRCQVTACLLPGYLIDSAAAFIYSNPENRMMPPCNLQALRAGGRPTIFYRTRHLSFSNATKKGI
jgi:hypothetical protein